MEERSPLNSMFNIMGPFHEGGLAVGSKTHFFAQFMKYTSTIYNEDTPIALKINSSDLVFKKCNLHIQRHCICKYKMTADEGCSLPSSAWHLPEALTICCQRKNTRLCEPLFLSSNTIPDQ